MASRGREGAGSQTKCSSTPAGAERQDTRVTDKTHGRPTVVSGLLAARRVLAVSPSAAALQREPADQDSWAADKAPQERQGACDGPDWVGPHFSPTCADASLADPEVFEHHTNQGVLRQHQREIGKLNSLASGCHREKANGEKANEEKANKEKEEGATKDASERPRETTEQSVPLGDRRREETRKLVVPIGDRRTSLRKAECDRPPRFGRSMAESGTWKWPGQG
ncbi:hypothetical protein NDU88_006059 [Pleurodeles waltl]|uniref:Uncharacterized protein n=1 Tax=Pleurodeles waltl TaxID=8319 RepID=A0AAV7PIP6_PLEWA|nr:hypothetical protein NDU88_006059 [Pleurodeles waltl]